MLDYLQVLPCSMEYSRNHAVCIHTCVSYMADWSMSSPCNLNLHDATGPSYHIVSYHIVSYRTLPSLFPTILNQSINQSSQPTDTPRFLTPQPLQLPQNNHVRIQKPIHALAHTRLLVLVQLARLDGACRDALAETGIGQGMNCYSFSSR